MLWFIFMVAVCGQSLEANALDNYSNLNAKTVKETIKRGAEYMLCMMYINTCIRSCVVWASASDTKISVQSLVRNWGQFQAPNKCFMSIENQQGCSSFHAMKVVEK